MADRCAWSERVVGAEGTLDAEVTAHLESCATCSAERSAHDDLLGSFRGLARPALSPHFHPQLMALVEKERRYRRVNRRRLLMLRLYWLAASVVCAAVLVNLAVSRSAEMWQTPILIAVALFVVPMAALLIAIRTDPFELILRAITGITETGLVGGRRS